MFAVRETERLGGEEGKRERGGRLAGPSVQKRAVVVVVLVVVICS